MIPVDTPERLRRARAKLKLTKHGLARALRMGANGYQSVIRWEKDGNTIPGPVQIAVEYMLRDKEFVTIERGDRPTPAKPFADG